MATDMDTRQICSKLTRMQAVSDFLISILEYPSYGSAGKVKVVSIFFY